MCNGPRACKSARGRDMVLPLARGISSLHRRDMASPLYKEPKILYDICYVNFVANKIIQ